jgi:hypothetical protein
VTNEAYAKALEAAWSGEIDLLTSDVRFVVVDGDVYSPDTDNDEFLSDIPSGAIIGTSDLVTGKSLSGKAFSSSGITFSDSPGDPGSPVVAELLIGYTDTTDAATSRLLAKIDTGSNLPVTLNGSVITVLFPDNKIFDL